MKAKVQIYIKGLSDEEIRELENAEINLVVSKRKRKSDKDDGDYGAVIYTGKSGGITRTAERGSGAGWAVYCVNVKNKRMWKRKNVQRQRHKKITKDIFARRRG